MLTEKTQSFLEAVCREIRWPAARIGIQAELAGHVAEHADELLAEGLSPDAAEEQALLAMGNAQDIGRQLDGLHRPRLAWIFLLLGVVLSVISLAHQQYSTQWGYRMAESTFLGLMLGLLLAAGCYFCDYQKWLKRSPAVYGLAWLLLLVVLILGPTGAINGRSVFISGSRTQIFPAVLMVMLTLATVGLLYRLRFKGVRGLMVGGVLAALTLLAVMPLDLTLALIMGVLYVVIITLLVHAGYFGRRRTGYGIILGALTAALAAGTLFVITQPHRVKRIMDMLHPFDHMAMGHNARVILTLQNARWIGPANWDFLQSRSQSPSILLEGHSNYVFVRMINDWGLAAGIGIVVCLALFLGYGYYKMTHTKDLYGRLLGTAALTLLAGQSVVHILMNLGCFWPTDIQLPFFSAGGTNMVVSWLLLGIVLSVWRRSGILTEVDPPGALDHSEALPPEKKAAGWEKTAEN